MRFSPLVDRVAGRGAAAWRTHFEAVRRQAAGEEIIFLTVGDPDQPPPAAMIEGTIASLRRLKTGYSPISGIPELRATIAARIAARSGRPCAAENVTIVP